MDSEHRKRVTADQTPDRDSSLPNAATHSRPLSALRRAGTLSHAQETADVRRLAVAPVASNPIREQKMPATTQPGRIEQVRRREGVRLAETAV